MIYFADTSAFAKRYIQEVGSAWVLSWITPGANQIIYVSAISSVEFSSILARSLREGRITPQNFMILQNQFNFHVYHEYNRVAVSHSVLHKAERLVAMYPLRALDAVQLACALNVVHYAPSRPIFVTSDQRLLAAAKAEGFPVEDPNTHL